MRRFEDGVMRRAWIWASMLATTALYMVPVAFTACRVLGVYNFNLDSLVLAILFIVFYPIATVLLLLMYKLWEDE